LEDLVQENTELLELSHDELPEKCRFLLEVNFTKLTSSHLETQRYWTLAMNASLAARQLKRKKGAQSKRTHLKVKRKIPSQKKLGIEAIKQQIRLDEMHKPPTTNSTDDIHQGTQITLPSLIIKRPHPSSTLTTLKSYKRLCKPDLYTRLHNTCVRGYTLSMLQAFLLRLNLNNLRPKGTGARDTGPVHPVAGLLW
jgi:hypothetical protein